MTACHSDHSPISGIGLLNLQGRFPDLTPPRSYLLLTFTII